MSIVKRSGPELDALLKSLESRADFFAQASLSPATRRAYETDWKDFWKFCIELDQVELPATSDTVCLYLTHLADTGSTVSTVTRRCTSITAIHHAAGFESPVKSDRVSRVLAGIRRTKGAPPAAARPLSWDDIRKLVSNCDFTAMGVRDAALLTFGWASALRRSELCALDVGDLEISDRGILLTVRRSKTDQEGAGAVVGVPRSGNGLCPVAAVERYLSRRSEKGLPSEAPLFVHLGVRSKGHWCWESDKRLNDRNVSAIVKRYAQFAGMSPRHYSAHSLRRGMATSAGAAGVPERVISRHTRHRSILVLRQYIESGSIWSENPLLAVYGSSSSSSSSGD